MGSKPTHLLVSEASSTTISGGKVMETMQLHDFLLVAPQDCYATPTTGSAP